MLLPIGLVFLAVVDLVGGAGRRPRSGDLAGLVAAALVAAPIVWVGVRLSLATPMTFAEHRISLRDAWDLTRGRFWPLFGMILLAVIFYIIIWALILIIYAALTQAGGGPDNMLGAKGVGISPVAVVILLLTLALQMILPVLQSVMIYAPFAVAYQQLHGDAPANPLRAAAWSTAEPAHDPVFGERRGAGRLPGAAHPLAGGASAGRCSAVLALVAMIVVTVIVGVGVGLATGARPGAGAAGGHRRRRRRSGDRADRDRADRRALPPDAAARRARLPASAAWA